MDCRKFNASRSAGGWVISRFHLVVSRYSGQITWKGRCYFGLRTLRGGWREGGAACVSAISVPPVPCPDRNESHGNTTVRPFWRPRRGPSGRPSRPFCVQLGASLEIMLREHPSQPRPTLNGQDADRKIGKVSSRNSLTSQVQVSGSAAGTI